MKKPKFFFVCLLLLFQVSEGVAQKANLDSMYRILDDAIVHADQYVGIRQRRIRTLEGKLKRTSDKKARLTLHDQLYELYRPYRNDSAIYHLRQCVDLALSMNLKSLAGIYKSLISLQCSKTGMYDEAFSILSAVRLADLDRKGRATFYQAYYNVYHELSYYTQLDALNQTYSKAARKYEQLMFRNLSPTDDSYFQIREMDLLNTGHLRQSMALNNAWLKRVKKGSHRFAMVALYRYLEYKARRDTVPMMYWLAESALADVRNGVMDQGSMWEIANQLMLQGDVDRSYRYISFTSDCARKFGSRQRNWQISPLLSAIADNYKHTTERRNRQLRILLGVISILALSFLSSLFYVNRQRKRLAMARDQLRDINGKLSTLNTQLTDTNAQLSVLNQKLSDSSKVKEEYIGRFQGLCSEYIDKMDRFRKHVNRALKNRQIEGLLAETRSTEWKDREMEELYMNFDTSFLRLFPNFVKEFNALLREEDRITQTDPLRLNTPLRIFALIRLGIEDSSKIAEFLDYSVNTIYNYRARVKNGAVVGRDEFEQRVKEIGLPT